MRTRTPGSATAGSPSDTPCSRITGGPLPRPNIRTPARAVAESVAPNLARYLIGPLDTAAR